MHLIQIMHQMEDNEFIFCVKRRLAMNQVYTWFSYRSGGSLACHRMTGVPGRRPHAFTSRTRLVPVLRSRKYSRSSGELANVKRLWELDQCKARLF